MSDEIQLLLDVANEYGQVNVTVDEIKQIRAGAIDEISNALDELDTFCDNDHWTSDGSLMWKIKEVRQILEQLKEKNNV